MMNAIHQKPIDTSQVYAELQTRLEGELDFTDSGRALYTSDASNYRQVPLGVVYPRSVEDIRITNEICHRHHVPLLMRGAGTSQNGQCVNVAVILDCSRHLNRILKIDKAAQTAWVEPGVICDDLKAAAAKSGLTFGPDPGTHSRCTLGGMIGNNSCGPHSMQAGKTVENIESLEILTSDGAQFWVGPTSEEELEKIISGTGRQAEIYRELKAIRDEYADVIREKFPTIKRRVSGYNLDQLLPENGFNVARALVGSEGTCVSILQAKTKLIKQPACVTTLVLGFADIYLAGDSVPEILPFKPIAMEGLDWGIVGGLLELNLKQEEISLLPEGKAWLVVELDADTPEALVQHCKAFRQAMSEHPVVTSCIEVTAVEAGKIWSIRELGASATALSNHADEVDPVVGWEDTAVDPLHLGDYLREFQTLVDKYHYKTNLYGHFGDGCIHARITFDTRSKEGISKWREFSVEISELVLKYGGSLSGEHGDGQAKAEFLPLMFGPKLMKAFERFKAIWDRDNLMNPGKLINPYRMDENLRYGPDYQIPLVDTNFQFPDDHKGIARSFERCIGMAKCRSKTTPMCPSFQATGEERFSTRGRAHLLHEMLRGEVIKDGWNNQDIEHSLEHCLSCKACKTDCPTQVDIASYKAEFMAQHYSGKRRPLAHYVFGRIGEYLPLLARIPKLVNASISNPLLKKVIFKSFKLSEEHNLPTLSHQTFKDWAKKNSHQQEDNFYWFGDETHQPVILWIDSFNGYYRTQVLQAAVRALLKAKFRVGVARRRFCCGRPLYEHGFLKQAKQQLNEILEQFYEQLPDKAKVIVLEPSCLSVFKDELLNLMASDPRAPDLSKRVTTLIDFLSEQGIRPQRKMDSGILHLHCHHKSLLAGTQDKSWLTECFEQLPEPEKGCCGMAGSFGMKKQTREISKILFNRNLQPAIAQSSAETCVVANGFSCSEQIESQTGQKTMHPAEIVELCLEPANTATSLVESVPDPTAKITTNDIAL
ncbi:MAG: FAD-binding and (Fe-S)-binding domain-containing protein [Amphritea sp.]